MNLQETEGRPSLASVPPRGLAAEQAATPQGERTGFEAVELRFERLAPFAARARSHAFLERMRTRRSVRHFSDEPVLFELIENAILTAATAPSGANQQPWSFVVISDPKVKTRIRLAAEREEKLLYGQRASEEYLEAIKPIGTNWSKPHITDAPYLIAVFEQAWGYNARGEKKKHYYVRESVGIAIGFLLASLHAAGLATLSHSPAPMGFLKEILERPENERPVLLIPVGYPAPDATVPAIRKKPLTEVARFILGPASEASGGTIGSR